MSLGQPEEYRPPWQHEAECGKKPSYYLYFFPELPSDPMVNFSKKLCERCTVRRECAVYAWDNDIQHGTWGGHTEWERRQAKAMYSILRPNKTTEMPAATAELNAGNEYFVFTITLGGVTPPDLNDSSSDSIFRFHIDL